MERNELAELLFKNIKIVEPYPDFVAPVTRMIDITAFFPGGKGIWKETETEVFPTILVLGHDFSTEKAYLEMLDNKKNDLDGPTWRNMIKLFNQANIDLNNCFFSNVFMGLRKTDSMIGKFPGYKDKDFLKRNLEFLSYQIDTIRPKIVITLGKYAAELLSYLSEIDLGCWKFDKALRDTDVGIRFNVKFNNHTATCVALEHPSMRNSNVKRRYYKNYVGNDAEIMMLKDSLANS